LDVSKFDCAFIDAMLLTTEKEAMERFLLEIRARILANLPSLYGRNPSDGEVIGIRHASFNLSEMHDASSGIELGH
jgi:hypothetical protein